MSFTTLPLDRADTVPKKGLHTAWTSARARPEVTVPRLISDALGRARTGWPASGPLVGCYLGTEPLTTQPLRETVVPHDHQQVITLNVYTAVYIRKPDY